MTTPPLTRQQRRKVVLLAFLIILALIGYGPEAIKGLTIGIGFAVGAAYMRSGND